MLTFYNSLSSLFSSAFAPSYVTLLLFFTYFFSFNSPTSTTSSLWCDSPWITFTFRKTFLLFFSCLNKVYFCIILTRTISHVLSSLFLNHIFASHNSFRPQKSSNIFSSVSFPYMIPSMYIFKPFRTFPDITIKISQTDHQIIYICHAPLRRHFFIKSLFACIWFSTLCCISTYYFHQLFSKD